MTYASTPIKEIKEALNGFYREKGTLPRFIEVNEAEWENLGARNSFAATIETIGIIGGVPVVPLQTVQDWIFVE